MVLLPSVRYRLTIVLISGHSSIRAALVGNFSDQFSGIINLKNTLYNGNSSDVGYKETPDGQALYLYAAEGGWDYIQACGSCMLLVGFESCSCL